MGLSSALLETPYQCDKPYRVTMDSLICLPVCTRANIALAVARLAKLVEQPTMIHSSCVKWILRYLIHTIVQGLTYSYSHGAFPTVYVHSDWASNTSCRKHVSEKVAISLVLLCRGTLDNRRW